MTPTLSRVSAPLLALALLAGWEACDAPDEAEEQATTAAEPTSTPDSAGQPAEAGDPHAHHEDLPAAEPLPGASLLQLDLSLTDQRGRTLRLAELRGRPVIASMVYTSCTTACPMIVQEIERIVAAADEGGRADVRILLLSMDPERDSPEALRAFADLHALDERWLVARAEDAQVREFAAVLGTRYRRLPSGDFNHSPVIALLDAQGVLSGRMEGFGEQRGDLVERLRALLE